jgi:NADPH-dependent curcumin reductase CurA
LLFLAQIAVGSIVGQIGKVWVRVVGNAGTDEKVNAKNRLGFDAA